MTTSSSPQRRPSLFGGLAAIIGSLLTISGVFSGWVTLGVAGETVTDSGWALTAGEGYIKSNDPFLLLALAAAGVVVGALLTLGVLRPLARLGALAVGIGTIVVAALNWMAIADYVTDNFPTDFEADAALGFYLVIAGGIVTALAALLPAKKP